MMPTIPEVTHPLHDPDTEYPLLDTDGTPLCAWPIERIDPSPCTGTGGSASVARNFLRRASSRTSRGGTTRRGTQYKMTLRGAESLRRVALTRAASPDGATKWRHPKEDPPGSVADAPPYQLIVSNQQALTADRRTHNDASVEVVLLRLG